ncbi:phosphotransferase family protein, partial [Qipengyuania sp.]|uniref:phosphotransferase family protein n=1 Tax=Qipengyuania sp. TaxID=2004515 RepID=UPI003736DAAD
LVPRLVGVCEDPAVADVPVVVMEHVDGIVLDRMEVAESLDPAVRRELGLNLARTLAHIHAVDVDAVGLGDLASRSPYAERQLKRWSRQFEASRTQERPDLDELTELLRANVPPPGDLSLVHGDFHIRNVIVDGEDDTVRTVLDWELSTLGDPIADFSYLMLNWHNPTDGRAGLLGLDLETLGIPSQEEAVERYVARTGFPVPPMDWYFAYNLFRLAGIMQGIKKRVIDGTASSAHAMAMSERVGPLVDRAYEFAQSAGMD